MRFVLIIVALLSLSACTKVAFKTDKELAMKTGTITDNVDDGNSHHHPGGGSVNTGGGTNNGSGTTTTVNPTPTPKYTTPTNNGGDGLPTTGTTIVDDNIPVNRHCSDAKSFNLGANVHSATSLKVTISDANGAIVCTNTNTAQIRAELMAGYFSFCSTLEDGNYSVSVLANGSAQLTLAAGQHNGAKNTFSVSGGKVTTNVSIVMDTNPNSDKEIGNLLEHDNAYICDSSASPLYVDMRRNSSDTDFLSAPQRGVMFDILGANGTPAYHKSQISWFEKGRFGLLTLPNGNGNVLNIDQLFGNNTLGDDNDFADNGFLALAKYDSNHDNVIDPKDEVFSQLRLWFDVDRDAKAERRELKSLSDVGIVAIDLEYDPNYSERDKYGNEVKLKSVVKFADGKLKPIFDLWFALTD